MDEVVEKLEESVAELLIEIRRPRLIIESIVKARRPGRKNSSGLISNCLSRLYMRPRNELTKRLTRLSLKKSSLIRLLRLLLIKLPEARQCMIILPEKSRLYLIRPAKETRL